MAGESAGGYLAAAVALRPRDAGDTSLAGQVLIYPAVAGTMVHPSTRQFDGVDPEPYRQEALLGRLQRWASLDGDPYAVPLCADDPTGVAPAIVVLGGLRHAPGRGGGPTPPAYAATGSRWKRCVTRASLYGFANLEFPAAALAFERIGDWFRGLFAGAV